jgi:cytochrome c-type biogenesis protein CcmH/NrfF
MHVCEIVRDRMRETKKDRDIYREIVERYVQTMFFVDRIVYKYAILYCLLIVALYPPLSLFNIIETKNNDHRSLLWLYSKCSIIALLI